MEPTYHLEGVIRSKEEMEDFEGPLNLILMLLSKNKIEIRNIQVSEILDQYLAYLDEMKAMDLEVASEFVQMASHLLYIKTRMLLTADEDQVSELELLISSLEQLKARDIYGAIREITSAFSRASEQGFLYHTKQPEPIKGAREYRYSHEGWELLKAISDVISRGRTATDEESGESGFRKRIIPKRIVYNVRDKSREIVRRLSALGSMPLSRFYEESHSRSELVATFISILELCSLGHAALKRDGGQIIVSFTGDDAAKIIESIGE